MPCRIRKLGRAKIIVQEVTSRFGVPNKIHSVQERQYLFAGMCEILQIEKKKKKKQKKKLKKKYENNAVPTAVRWYGRKV